MNILKSIFVKDEVNISRQVEFDFAKAVCIVFMILIHSFEQLSATSVVKNGPIHYAIVIVVDVLFGASIFMQCMGLGTVYGSRKEPDEFISRGLRFFWAGYVLNIFRTVIPYIFTVLIGVKEFNIEIFIANFLCNDILQFAGLGLILFGLLRKCKCSDLALLFIALIMSIIGSMVRFINLNNPLVNQILGLFIGTTDDYLDELGIETSVFPLLNWFIVVVVGHLYAKALRHVKDIEKFYSITLPISAIPLIIYMIIAIPNRIGMMSKDINNYYFFTTPNILILFIALVFATSFYHLILKSISEKSKDNIICISNNLTPIYFYQWIIVLVIYTIAVDICKLEFSNEIVIVIIGIIVCILSMFLGIHYPNWIKKMVS